MLKHDHALRQGRIYNLDPADARRLVDKGAGVYADQDQQKATRPSEIKPTGPTESKGAEPAPAVPAVEPIVVSPGEDQRDNDRSRRKKKF
jgi:hypothetical protein